MQQLESQFLKYTGFNIRSILKHPTTTQPTSQKIVNDDINQIKSFVTQLPQQQNPFFDIQQQSNNDLMKIGLLYQPCQKMTEQHDILKILKCEEDGEMLEEGEISLDNKMLVRQQTLIRQSKACHGQTKLLYKHLDSYTQFKHCYNLSKHVQYNYVQLSRDSNVMINKSKTWIQQQGIIKCSKPIILISIASKSMCWVTVYNDSSNINLNKSQRINYKIGQGMINSIDMQKLVDGYYYQYFMGTDNCNFDKKLTLQKHGVKKSYVIDNWNNLNKYRNFNKFEMTNNFEKRLQIYDMKDIKCIKQGQITIVQWESAGKIYKIKITNNQWLDWQLKKDEAEKQLTIIMQNIKEIHEQKTDILIDIYDKQLQFQCSIIYLL